MPTDPSEIRVLGPLSAFTAGFAVELARQGYTPRGVCGHLWRLAQLSRWLASERLGVEKLHMIEVDRFLLARRAAGYQVSLSINGMQPILSYLRNLGVAPALQPPMPSGPVEVVLERYRNYLTVERGLVRQVARGYVNAVRPFLRGRVSLNGLALDLEHLCAADVITFVVAHCPDQNRGAAKLTVTALRSLLRFLYVDGAIKQSLISAVPSVVRRRLAGLPKGLDAAQVQWLLASCDHRTPKGRRDLAILTMLVRLGMRAGEVAALRLDDIDWRTGELVVRGKGNCIERLPLPTDVGEAVAAYLCCGRRASAQDQTVFVRTRTPHRALSPAGLSNIVAAAARRAELGQFYAHRLRHTAATQMLRAGASLPEIGQVLRHRQALTTAIYAKVDREALRTIARPWPGDVA